MQMDNVGVHFIADIHDIENYNILNTVENMKKIMDSIVDAYHFNVINKACHQFEPVGATCVYLLSESHISCHTYPERRSCYMDIFCCSESAVNFRPAMFIEIMKKVFSTCTVSYSTIKRI